MDKPNFKQRKWYNFGDANPRIHGGVFIRRNDDEIEVISTDNKEEIYGNKGYIFNSRIDYVSELISLYETFKINPNNGVGSSCDWKRYIELEKEGWEIEQIVMYLAADMISYFGGDCETDNDDNYWGYLGSYGIRCNNFS